MPYSVKEVYFTLQGEGAHTGRPAVFCRFSRCNLWSGHEADRAKAICRFCDTDFVGTDGPGGGEFVDATTLAQAISRSWPVNSDAKQQPFVVCTGGEPLLQLDQPLVNAIHREGFEIAIETNGTIPPPDGIDWVCVSPKAGSKLVLKTGQELKLVFPQEGALPESYAHLDFDYFFLQPMDGPDRQRNTELAIAYCQQHPQWRLSLQTHKILGIP